MELRIKCCTRAQWFCHSPPTSTGMKQLCYLHVLYIKQHLVKLHCTRISCLWPQLCDNSEELWHRPTVVQGRQWSHLWDPEGEESVSVACVAFRRCAAFKASSPNTFWPFYSTSLKIFPAYLPCCTRLCDLSHWHLWHRTEWFRRSPQETALRGSTFQCK